MGRGSGGDGVAGGWRGWGAEGFGGRHEEGYWPHYRLSIVLVSTSFEWNGVGNIGRRSVPLGPPARESWVARGGLKPIARDSLDGRIKVGGESFIASVDH